MITMCMPLTRVAVVGVRLGETETGSMSTGLAVVMLVSAIWGQQVQWAQGLVRQGWRQ